MNLNILPRAGTALTRVALGTTIAAALALGTGAAAGAQIGAPMPKEQPQQPTGQAPTATAARVTVEGCLVSEDKVPGREPNIAERAGILEDYILTSTRVVKGTAPKASSSPDSPSSAAPSSATVARSPMYKVTGIDDDRLKQLLNQRVQVEGIFVDVDRENAAPQAAAAVEDLVEIRGATIREVPGGVCPAK